MNWGSWGGFWAMGGYGLYVWGSFGVCALIMAIEPVLARRRHAQAMKQLALTLAAQEGETT